MYAKLLSAGILAGMFPGTCDSTLSPYGPQVQVPTLLVSADSGFDYEHGGKTRLFMATEDPPPDPPEGPDWPEEPPADPE